MLHARNTHGGPQTTRVRRGITLAAWCLLVLACAGRLATAADDAPSEEAARAAFETARRWTSAFSVPAPEAADAKVHVEGARGVCVLLRRSGRVVGSGADWTGDDLMLRRAVARALGELLGEPAVESLPESMRGSVGAMVSIELEIAGMPQPLVATSFEQAGRQLDPGIDGIAMRRDQAWAFLFPAQFRASNTAASAHRQFLALATDLNLPATQLSELRQKFGAAAYSFRTITLMQPAPHEAPIVTVRGENIVPLDAVTPAAVAQWAQDSARHLLDVLAFAKRTPGDMGMGDLHPQPVGLPGTYNPLADAFDPIIAPPLEQAICAYALRAAAESNALPADVRDECMLAALTILRDLAVITQLERDPLESAPACALIVVASDGIGADETALLDLRKHAIDRMMRSFAPVMRFDDSLSPHERALIAWAMVRLSESDPLAVPAPTARDAVEAAWTSAAESERVALLPWIGWALRDLASENGAPSHAAELRELAAGLLASRVTANSAPAADLAGGLPLALAARPLPTSQTLRPAAWLASALRDPHLVSAADRVQRRSEWREVLRFIRQLMVRPEVEWRYRNHARAVGGFRTSTWDISQPLPAQALGLLTLLEAAESLADAPFGQPEKAATRTSP